MSSSQELEKLTQQEYKYGWTSEIESDVMPAGLSEDVVRMISAKKNEPEFMLEWRLKAYRHWPTMSEPRWANVKYPPMDYQEISYYSAPKKKKQLESLDEVDRSCWRRIEKLGIPLHEQKRLAGVAVDAVFDSVSVATTFKEKLVEAWDHFLLVLRGGSEPSGAGEEISRIGRCRTRTTSSPRSTPRSSATDRSAMCQRVCKCPMELSTYFRINTAGYGAVRADADHRRRGRVR